VASLRSLAVSAVAPQLAVVVITKDQAFNIDRLLSSVLREVAAVSAELVVVDSASVDATVERACRHPVQVVRLHSDQVLTAAAGRAVGSRRTTAERLLFLDGDMELCPGWLDQALRVMDDRPEVAVVTGQVVDVPRMSVGLHPPGGGPDAQVVEVLYTGGAAMHRRQVLTEVGGFNPYLRSDEEPEVCVRIQRAGYRIARLERPLALHYTEPPDALATVVKRWRRGLYLGAGQALRHNLHRRDVLWSYARQRGYGILPGFGLLAGLVASLLAVGTGRTGPLRACGTLGGAIVAADLVRRRDPQQTAHSLIERLAIVDGTVRGFLLRPHAPSAYAGRHDVIRSASVARADELSPT